MISWLRIAPYIGAAAFAGIAWWHYQSLLDDREALRRTKDALMGCYSDLEQQALMAQENRKKADRYYDQMESITDQRDAVLRRVRAGNSKAASMPDTAAASDAPSCPTGREFHYANGIIVERLLDFAADCERVRQNALGWIEWNRETK